ncbi:MAG: metal-dependent transcriptional regulator [Lachnospiraceae bacterium]|nr:metal-dependent transcriptional regulator [Lachnospiraceae bacterium]
MNESAENYIKTIYALKKKLKSVRSIDIANEMGFSRASVSAAVANLKKKDLIIVKNNGAIEFTVQGEKIAGDIYERHATLSGFLMDVAGVDEKTAKEDACRIEHFISPSTLEGIKKFIKGHHKDELSGSFNES